MIRIAALFLLVSVIAFGQTAAGIAPPLKFQPLDQNGKTLPGGCVFSYQGGTATLQATFTDSTGTVQNLNPITLDSGGRASVWLGNSTYKFTVTNAPASGGCSVSNFGATQFTVDNVTSWNAPGSGSVTVPFGQTLTLQAGSSTSLGASLIPGAAGTYDLGSVGTPWRILYANSPLFAGPISESTNNAYDLGSISVAMRNVYAFGALLNSLKWCGTSGGLLASAQCWTWTPTIDGSNNSFVVLTDDTGTFRVSLATKAAGSAALHASFNLPVIPGADNTWDLGCQTCGAGSTPLQWHNIYMTGSIISSNPGSFIGGQINVSGLASGTHGVIVGGGEDISLAGRNFAALGTAVPGAVTWCTNCATASNPCTGAGSGAWAFGVAGPAWNCPF